MRIFCRACRKAAELMLKSYPDHYRAARDSLDGRRRALRTRGIARRPCRRHSATASAARLEEYGLLSRVLDRPIGI